MQGAGGLDTGGERATDGVECVDAHDGGFAIAHVKYERRRRGQRVHDRVKGGDEGNGHGLADMDGEKKGGGRAVGRRVRRKSAKVLMEINQGVHDSLSSPNSVQRIRWPARRGPAAA